MLSIGQQKVDLLGLCIVAGLLIAVTAVSVYLPQLTPWSYLALAAGAVLVYWSIRWEIQLWAWLWVLSYGIVDRGLWRLELAGFFNLTIPRLIFLAGLAGFFLYVLAGRCRLRFDRSLMWAMAALIGYCAVSASLAGWKASTPQVESAPYYRFMVALAFPFLVFLMVYNSTNRPKQIRIGLLMISIYGWYALYLSYLQYAAVRGWDGARAFIWPGYINDPNYGIHFERARGAFNAAGPQAMFLVVLFFTSLFLFRKVGGLYKAALLIQVILTPPAIFFAGIRASFVAFGLCGILWCLLGSRDRFGSIKLAMAALVLVVGTATFWTNLSGTDRATGGVAQRGPIQSRKILLYQSWEVFQNSPITGAGFGHFVDAQQQLERDPSSLVGLSTGVVVQHNLLLNMAAETGAIGLIGVLIVALLLYRQSHQLYRKIPIGASGDLSREFVVLFWIVLINYATTAMFRDTFWDVFANGLLWSFAGLVVAYNQMLEPHHVELPAGATGHAG